MDNFEKGFEFFRENVGSIAGEEMSMEYINKISDAISKLENDLNSFSDYNTPIAQLKGDVFEFWQSDTFNINAALKDSESTTFVNRSNDYGSVDISSNFDKAFGLKAYSNAQESAKAQSISVFQKFKEYESAGGKLDLENYLKERGLDSENVLNDPLYSGQIRVIPKDQLKDAIDFLKLQIAKEKLRRPDQVYRYQETLKNLTDKLSDGKGVESISLTKAEAEELARLAKQNRFDPSEFGISINELMKFEYIVQQSFKAGTTAATLSLVLKVAPEIYHSIDYLIKEGEIDQDAFKKIGSAAITGASEGFIKGSISAAITASIKSGILGEVLKELNPSIIGAATNITYNVILNTISISNRSKTRSDVVNELIRDLYLSSISMMLGGITQGAINVPFIGFMIGSFLGSVIGSFTYDLAQKAVVSFCKESGFTLFGLVEQNYRLPKELIKEMGFDTFNFDTFETDTLTTETFEFDTFIPDSFKPETLNITFLRRGVIGVSKVAYI